MSTTLMTILFVACIALIITLFITLFLESKKKNKIKETVEVRNNASKYVNVYRTKDGKSSYIFRYVPVRQGFYEIDIIYQPSYKGRNADAHVSHRLQSDRSDCRYKICIYSHRAPQTLEAAMQISAAWAELTDRYIKTGRHLD